MFTLIVLSIAVAVASASPSGQHAGILSYAAPYDNEAIITEAAGVAVHQPVLAEVGKRIDSIPTAVSHQSSTIVHGGSKKITPILEHGVKSYLAPAVRTYEAPILKSYSAPAVHSYSAPAAVHAYAAPASIHGYAAPAAIHGYAAPAAIHGYAGPAAIHGYAVPAAIHGYAAPSAIHGYSNHGLHAYASQTLGRIEHTPLLRSYAEHIPAEIHSAKLVRSW